MRTVKRKALAGLVAVGALILVFCLGWYLVSRLTNPWRAVKIRTLADPGPREVLAAGAELRIGAYNIAHGRGLALSTLEGGDRATRLARLKDIARAIKDARLDVVALNEVDFRAPWSHYVNQAEFIARRVGFPYLVEQRNWDIALPFYGIRWGNAVLSRFPVTESRLLDYPVHSTSENVLAGRKKGAVCTLQLSPGRVIRFVSVHLEHRSESVRVQSAALIEKTRQESNLPLVCAGDFNSTPADFPHAILDEQGRSALSFLLEGGGFRTLPTGSPGPGDFTFHSARPDRVIDWILVPASWRITSKQVLPVQYSDHRPIVATVVMERP